MPQLATPDSICADLQDTLGAEIDYSITLTTVRFFHEDMPAFPIYTVKHVAGASHWEVLEDENPIIDYCISQQDALEALSEYVNTVLSLRDTE
jgi:hypothetical protein